MFSGSKTTELLKIGMIGGYSIMFYRHHEVRRTKISDHAHEEKEKDFKLILIHLDCVGKEIPCKKEGYTDLGEKGV